MHPSYGIFQYFYKISNDLELTFERCKQSGILNDGVEFERFKEWFNEQIPEDELKIINEEVQEFLDNNKLFLGFDKLILRNLTFKALITVMINMQFTDEQIINTFDVSGYNSFESGLIKKFRVLVWNLNGIQSADEFDMYVESADYDKFSKFVKISFYKPDLDLIFKLGFMPPIESNKIIEATTSLAYSRLLNEMRNKHSTLSTTELIRMAFAAHDLKERMNREMQLSDAEQLKNLLSSLSIALDAARDVSYQDLITGKVKPKPLEENK